MAAEERDWNKLVEDSNGTLTFLPEALIPFAKAWVEKRDELNTLANEAAKIEFETTVALHALVMEIRKHFSENGYPMVWKSDVGMEGGALTEGKYVVSISAE